MKKIYLCSATGEELTLNFPAGAPIPSCPPGWLEIGGYLISDGVSSLSLLADGQELVIRQPKGRRKRARKSTPSE